MMLTSMKQWNKAIGGNEDNTNCLNKALKPLEATGTITRIPVECADKRKHFSVEANEQHLRHPRFIVPEAPRPHNGGDKRKCPQCQQPVKSNLKVTYECVKCGIDFDRDMQPIDHKVPQLEDAPSNVIPIRQEVVLTQEELDVFAPTKKKARG